MSDMSARSKFVLINLDDIAVAAVILVIVYFLFPGYLLAAIVLVMIGLVVLIAAKYYLIYPVIGDTTGVVYDVVGKTGTVIRDVTTSDGRVRIGGEIWHARCDETDVIKTGSPVRVVGRDRLVLLVAPLEDEITDE